MLQKELTSLKKRLLEQIEVIEEQLTMIPKIRTGTLVYAEYAHIKVAQSGVTSWRGSDSPILLKCTGWSIVGDGYAVDFLVLASQDPIPYESPFQSEYSGLRAQIRVPNYYDTKKIKIVQRKDLPLYINYRHTTKYYSSMFQ